MGADVNSIGSHYSKRVARRYLRLFPMYSNVAVMRALEIVLLLSPCNMPVGSFFGFGMRPNRIIFHLGLRLWLAIIAGLLVTRR